MNTSILFAVVCAASSVACEISCLEGDCDWDDECSEEHPNQGGSGNASGASGGRDASGGNQPGSSGNSGDAGGTANAAGKSGGSRPVPSSCSKESDCERGFNCDYERRECVPAGAETCPELSIEADCDNRNDCKSIYAGTNCSCGAECTCIGGEPGCVCQSFSFFTCEPLEG
ncbi:MAG TPA: hypothetical protein VJV79_29715 [Polyangiaceae bacterium]|nr:hypothetical protein [Polyangiaceae bacterium]